MEGEINNFIVLWLTVLASLCYCYTIGKFIPKGHMRLLTILPIILLFVLLPLNLTTFHLGGTSSLFIAWLTNFKLLLFIYGKGPLYSNPPLPLIHFILIASLPIQIQPSNKHDKDDKSHPNLEMGDQSLLNYATKIMVIVVVATISSYLEYLHPKIVLLIYGNYIIFMLEFTLALLAALARTVIGAELEPQFKTPHLSTSPQDFWGKRWNLVVSNILRLTIYQPSRQVFGRVIGQKWVSIPAAFTTFLVSGIMHELMFYNINGRLKPTGEIMRYFLVHGAAVSLEILVKKLLNGKFKLPLIASRLLTQIYMLATAFYLFYPAIKKCEADVRGCKECLAFVEFLKHGKLVSPSDISCPFS